MALRPGLRDLAWIAFGAALLGAILLLALQNYRGSELETRHAFRSTAIAQTGRLRAALATATEEAQSAVMAADDQAAHGFAEKARAAAVQVERERDALAALLATDGSREERELLAEFGRAFAECQRVDAELLALAVRGSNLKAAALAYGPAAEALAQMDAALGQLMATAARAPGEGGKQTLLSAARALGAARRIQALLPPHIAEASDARMDALEAAMAKDDLAVRADLAALAAQLPAANSELRIAMSAYTRFGELRAQILDLSRQNTNVKSLSLSLGAKRRAVRLAQDALGALETAVQAEALADRPPVNPR